MFDTGKGGDKPIGITPSIVTLKGAKNSTIPQWVPPVSVLNNQSNAAESQLTIAGENTAVPLAYGEVMLGGSIFALKYNTTDGYWTIGYALCMGEISAIDNVYLNGAAPLAGVSVDNYTGTTSQTANAKLSAVISGYTDTMIYSHPSGNIGIAYIVVQYHNSIYPSPPNVWVRLHARKVYDPNSSTVVYSDNPALAMRDIITNVQFGLGEPIDDTSVLAVRSDCNGSAGGETRRLIGLVMDTSQLTTDWITTLQAYAGCWAFKRGDTWTLVSDRPRSSDATLTAADMVAGSFTINLEDPTDIPTVVRVQYTDTSTIPWREREAVAPTSLPTVRRESYVRLPGITRYSQAKREAEERLAKLKRGALRFQWVGFDESLAREIGDVVTVTHPYGISARTLRITAPPRLVSAGRVSLEAVDYSSADYNDTAATVTWGASDTFAGATVQPPVTKTKTSGTSRASTSTLADDPDLAGFTLQAASIYAFRMELYMTIPATPDMKILLNFSQTPQSLDLYFTGLDAVGNGFGQFNNNLNTVTINILGGGGQATYIFTGSILTHATLSGLLALQWAQITSSVNACIMLTKSTMILTKQ